MALSSHVTTITRSSEAWRLLQGLVALYKPAGLSQTKVVGMVQNNLAEELNCLKRTIKKENGELLVTDNLSMTTSKDEGGEMIDYSSHPLVLGPGYVWDDVNIYTVNNLNLEVSGVLVAGVNRGTNIARRLHQVQLPITYQVKGEWGRATHNGWSTGKTRMKCGWRHLANRPWLLEQYLANISANHQRQAWAASDNDMDTQEGYESALLGPPKPDILSDTLVYSIKCKEWKPPNFCLELVCIEPRLPEGQRQDSLINLVQEIGVRCKTVAQVHSVRCAAVGPWTSDQALLLKHWTLDHLLASMGDNKKIIRKFWGGVNDINKTGNFQMEVDNRRSPDSNKSSCGTFSNNFQIKGKI